ncbi:MAG: hypothetical protein JWO38_6565 [Gemmataceae bacterium]|nr:hypothetical protein [Gemmataceae bacterium]
MTEECIVFRVDPSVEDDRPVIEFDAPANRGIDWRRLDAILHGERPTADYRELGIVVRRADTTSWGYYSVPGTLGLLSGEAVRCIGPTAFGRFVLLPARLNGSEYYFLKVAERLPCLDLARAEVVSFRTSPERIKDITKYAFHKPMIPDPLVFSIPELPGWFATPAVAEAIERGRVPGFQFTPLG